MTGVSRSLVRGGVATAALLAVPVGSAPVTFTKDVAPILFKNCASCHRAGELAPMSLTSYKDARPWARAVKKAVVERAMPPWGADPRFGKFGLAVTPTLDSFARLIPLTTKSTVPADTVVPIAAPASVSLCLAFLQ